MIAPRLRARFARYQRDDQRHLMVDTHEFAPEVEEWLREHNIRAFCGFKNTSFVDFDYAIGFTCAKDAIEFKLRFL